ncbi:SulP family inorganic anion transporter [Chitinimonas sp. BJB300]|uniref:SulP family inorganic anion transporter n=1 Tax=Chitinimonas sp. BJB300 TaxID=1559339 RepID=UPI000C10E3DB|nr:SulP family inorganic anion transporter [Chitinimonas sp. BJB300]PHV10326.1 sodium-independent anion transporter [Chitinimonas sp. BJB300]TSJ91623.1 STAS domain-containing protein [Chitinimonas sp. BJB300]
MNIAPYLPHFRPRLLDFLGRCDSASVRADLIAGLTVAVVALPLAMAFAIASGVPPQAGIFTAIIAGLLISGLGGSRLCIGGPTGAYIVILHGIAVQYGVANLAVATFMAGIMLLLMGVFRLGQFIRFFPMPIITGFTNGIAVIILLTQLKDFFGLQVASMPDNFFAVLHLLWHEIGNLHWPTFLLALSSLVVILSWPKRFGRRLPAPFVALVGAGLVTALAHLPVATIGSKFGGIPLGLPTFTPLLFDWENFSNLLSPASKIALLGAIESLLCAVVADKATGDHHDSDQELMAQGIANLVVPLFGGIAATGAIARTATNIQNGGRTPLAGIFHALALLIVVLVAAPLASYVPLAVLAAILVATAIKMGDWDIRKAQHYPRRDTLVLATTFALTVLFDLTIAIEIGLLLAGMFFIFRIADQTVLKQLTPDYTEALIRHAIVGKVIPAHTVVYRMEGALFFGAADKLDLLLDEVADDKLVVVLQMHRVTLLDTTGLLAIEQLAVKLAARGQVLILCSVLADNAVRIAEAGLMQTLGADNIQLDLVGGLARAEAVVMSHKSSIAIKSGA